MSEVRRYELGVPGERVTIPRGEYVLASGFDELTEAHEQSLAVNAELQRDVRRLMDEVEGAKKELSLLMAVEAAHEQLDLMLHYNESPTEIDETADAADMLRYAKEALDKWRTDQEVGKP